MAETPPEICSCSALRQASRHVTRLYDAALSPLDLGLNQYAILAKLDRHGPKILQDLADLLVMDRSTLGHLIRPLESKGWIAIALSPADRRQRVISLTPAGAALMQRAKPLWAKAEARFEETLGEAEALGLRQLLTRVARLELHTPS